MMLSLTHPRSLLAALILFSGTIQAACLNIVPLQQGVNPLAIAHDKAEDFVVLATFENNTSHPNRSLSFYIKTAEGYTLVPVPDSDAFIWFDYRLAASRLKIFDYQLVRYPQGLRLITAEKVGEDLTDQQPVKLVRYALQESHDDPGVPPYNWQEETTVMTQKTYDSVENVLADTAALCALLP